MWSDIIQLTLMLILLMAIIMIFWLLKNDKLSTRLNQNTILMRYKNYFYIHIYSSPKDKRSCSKKRRSLARDARTVMRNLPEGKYATVSHKIVLDRLEDAQCGGIIKNLTAKLVYKASNKRNVSKFLGCRACEDKCNCSIYDDSKEKIDFYYIEFTKLCGDSVDEAL